MTPFENFFAATYEIVDTIKSSGKNFIAVVYDKSAGHLCVMKRRELRSMELYRILKACDNPHLPQIYRLFEQDGGLVVIEEHIDGQTLEEMLIHQPTALDEPFVLDILDQLCDCLIALHEKNIIHRDIKPSNIMIDRNKVVKLIDFGIARIFKPDSAADTEFLGTRGYAAPEQFGLFDLGQTDARTDIHALAVTVKQLLGADYRGRILPVLDRGTSLNPDDRYQSVVELVRAVKRTQTLQIVKRLGLVVAMTSIFFALPQLLNFETPPEPTPVENIPAPVEEKAVEEKPVEVTIEEAPSSVDDEVADRLINFVNTRQLEPPPRREPIPIVPTTVEPPPPIEIAKRPEIFLYINGELSPNRSAHSTAGDLILAAADVENWQRDSKGNLLFPADWTAKLTIQNHTARDLRNPLVKLDFDDEEIIIEHGDIKAGQTVDIDLPIANKPALSGDDYGQLSIELAADGEDLPLLIRDIAVNP